jgi:hypothetical protein
MKPGRHFFSRGNCRKFFIQGQASLNEKIPIVDSNKQLRPVNHSQLVIGVALG